MSPRHSSDTDGQGETQSGIVSPALFYRNMAPRGGVPGIPALPRALVNSQLRVAGGEAARAFGAGIPVLRCSLWGDFTRFPLVLSPFFFAFFTDGFIA